jgi:tetratricopeptide (TPR) repeat protein
VKENLLDSAEAVYGWVLAVRKRDLSPSHLATAATRIGLGRVLTLKGEYEAAEPLLRQGLKTRADALPSGNWQVADAQSQLGACLLGSKRYDEAEPLLTEAYATLSSCKGNRQRQTREAVQRLAQLYDRVGKSGKANQYRALLASLK